MSKPIKVYKKGKCQIAIWQGEYEGKPTISFSIKKSYFDKKTNTWKDSSYYSLTDLADIHFLTQTVITNNINKSTEKKQNPVIKQVQETFNDPYQEDANIEF